ncbi:hypothetical protein JG687_00016306 [Phytophthora cactorum]|uniref:Uncharacterized protein n=1 Tax=Phytophthora cactorum TaxID=29920 RepID=A0A8T1TVL0_9STRA|nr:hypothetical protein JG687_00016306 [Phytophthora cactorum]
MSWRVRCAAHCGARRWTRHRKYRAALLPRAVKWSGKQPRSIVAFGVVELSSLLVIVFIIQQMLRICMLHLLFTVADEWCSRTCTCEYSTRSKTRLNTMARGVKYSTYGSYMDIDLLCQAQISAFHFLGFVKHNH